MRHETGSAPYSHTEPPHTKGYEKIACPAAVSASDATAKIPVEEDIIRQTLDSESPYYYPNLMLRYQSGDDSMTEEDYHYLYYGYAYQDAYKPLNANSDMDKAILIAQTVDFENPTHESLEKLIAAVNDALVQDPFSPNC